MGLRFTPIRLTPALVAAFWARTSKAGGDACWLWTGCREKRGGGYGVFRVGGRSGPTTKAHRLSWTIHNGEIPDGLVVCHRCDNTGCVNPAHLFLGTQADNVADMHAKGRANKAYGLRNPRYTHPETSPRGEGHGRARVTAEQVAEIRRLSGEGRTRREVAARFGIGTSQVSRIARGQHWKHTISQEPNHD